MGVFIWKAAEKKLKDDLDKDSDDHTLGPTYRVAYIPLFLRETSLGISWNGQ